MGCAPYTHRAILKGGTSTMMHLESGMHGGWATEPGRAPTVEASFTKTSLGMNMHPLGMEGQRSPGNRMNHEGLLSAPLFFLTDDWAKIEENPFFINIFTC